MILGMYFSDFFLDIFWSSRRVILYNTRILRIVYTIITILLLLLLYYYTNTIVRCAHAFRFEIAR